MHRHLHTFALVVFLLTTVMWLPFPLHGQEEEITTVAIQSTWDSLLRDKLQEISSLRDEIRSFQERLPELTTPLTENLPPLEEAYKRLAAIAQVSRHSPPDLTVILERTRRLQERLVQLSDGIHLSLGSMAEQLAQLNALEQDAPQDASEQLAQFHADLKLAQQELNRLQARIDTILAPVNSLRDDLEALRSRLDTAMPELWKEYYLSPTGNLLDAANWSTGMVSLEAAKNVLSLRWETDVPQGSREWLFVGLRTVVIFSMLAALLYLARRPVQDLPEEFRPGSLRIIRNSGLWIALGLSLHYAGWSNGNLYQLLASFGTMLLAWGQMTLAWDLRSFCESDEGRISPLWPLFFPLLVGMGLLFLNPIPLLLGGIWLVYLAFIIWRLHRRSPSAEPVSRGLLYGFSALCWISMALTLFGLARLSILLCMAYTAVAVCIQQDMALLKLGNKIEQHLPQKGRGALIGRLVLSLAIPTILLIATLTPLLWILAYPGGAYLVRHLSNVGFNIGQVSVNAIQALSIIIVFYLIKSLISVGLTFINNLRSQGTRLSPSLAGPLRTAYTYVLWAFFIIYVLHALGFSLTSLAVVAGGLSVGVGLGLQNIVQNFISGLMVIFGQLIKEGDVVDVAGVNGTVKKINIRSTVVETGDNATVFVPNANFLSNTFTNWTHNSRRVRQSITLGVSHDADVRMCMKLLQEAAAQHPKVLKFPAPSARFVTFGDSALALQLIFWIGDIDDASGIITDIQLTIKESFAAHALAISHPQLDVHIKDQNP